MAKPTPPAKKPYPTAFSGKPLQPQKKPSLDKKPLIPEKYQDLFYIAMILISLIIFFSGAIFGNGFASTDTLSSFSFQTFLDQAKASGKFPLWVPYIFSGMPSYASLLTTGARVWDFVPQLVFGIASLFAKIFASDVARMALWYAFYGTGIYLLVRTKKEDRFIAFFAALAAVFSTWVILWAMIGHSTKPVVFAFLPFLFLFLEKLRIRFSILYSVLIVFSIHMMFEAGHIQMIFYSGLALGLYIVIELTNRIITKNEPLPFLRAAGILVAAGVIAFLMSSDRYLSTLEYMPYSTRGTAPIVKTVNQHQDATGGNDYDYATMWSFSPEEIKTFFVPNFYGFGKLEYQGNLTGNRAVKMQTYWGQKPFEDAAPYMGILVLMLAFVGFIKNMKDVFVQFLAILSFFALILSFGYTFPILYNIFFDIMPYFNKFRAPSMVLALVHFAVPLLAAYGLASILEMKREPSKQDKNIMYGLMGFAGLFMLWGLVYSSLFQNSYLEAVTASKMGQQFVGAYGASTFAEIANFIWEKMIMDWYAVAGIALVSSLLMYMFFKNKLSQPVFYISLLALLIIDLWRVGYRPMEIAETSAEKTTFQRTDVIDFIKQDKSKFRIADFTSQTANLPAYFLLENVNGYHSAKLRVYQDLLDVADQGSTSQVTNPFLWNLLNVKYIVSPQALGEMPPAFRSSQTGAYVYENTQMVPRVFFVDSIAIAKQLDILQNLKIGNFNPRSLAYLEKAPATPIEAAFGQGKARITNYENEYIKVETENPGNNLLVFSEIYYPVSWAAYIDGKPAEIYKTDFALRSVIVPAGKHTVEMKFTSPAFEKGKIISTSLNVVMIILLALGIYFEIKRRKRL